MKTWWMLVVPLLAACGEQMPPPDTNEAGPRPVKVLKVGAGTTASETPEDRYSGEVRARVETVLGFRVGGKIVERLVDAGMRVKAGQPLARLDPADQRLAAAQAEANRTLANAELKRTQELKAKNFISQAVLDAKQTAAAAAEAQAQLMKNQAAYTTLAADAAGVVAAVLAEPGQVVGAGQGMYRIARDGEREVAIVIPETRLAGLKVGAGATVALWSQDGGKTYQGRLRELAPVADPATRTFAARVTILDADDGVALGMTATVRFQQAAAEEIVVPLAAILQQGQGNGAPAVWVVGSDGAVSQRVIEVARYTDAGAVVKGGLKSGEAIVAAGAFMLAAGEKVRVANP